MNEAVVKTEYGRVRGYIRNGISIWKGIPYATARRFVHAAPPRGWTGVRDAFGYGPACPQEKKQVNVSEDCLYMNIWSKGTDGNKPVMLFLHGGSFCEGAASDGEFDGSVLALEDVVVVTINYRLGVLGFLDFSFVDEDFRPNCGLSDIVQAIRFAKENIAAFGGNPANITVFGQSAGAVICSALPVMPGVKEDISKVIMMSGAPTLMHTKQHSLGIAEKFTDFVNIRDAKTLRETDAVELVMRQTGFASHCGLGAGTFAIEVDGDLLPGYPIPLAAKGQAGKIPMLIGTTREEMSFLFIKPLQKRLDIRGIFEAGKRGEKESAMSDVPALYEKYGKRGKGIMMADLVFRLPSVWYAGEYSRFNATWMYRYDYESPVMRLSRLHAFHSTDLPMIFGTYSTSFYKFLYGVTRFMTYFKRLGATMRRDFADFAGTGSLPWEQCHGDSVPARCYDRRISTQQAVDDAVKDAFKASEFRRRSLEGKSNNLNL